MNTQHYPSFELCQKLSKIGFPPNTYLGRLVDTGDMIASEVVRPSRIYVCPSVMEMLDVIQTVPMRNFQIRILSGTTYMFVDTEEGTARNFSVELGLPNAIADSILWLHSESLISFNR